MTTSPRRECESISRAARRRFDGSMKNEWKEDDVTLSTQSKKSMLPRHSFVSIRRSRPPFVPMSSPRELRVGARVRVGNRPVDVDASRASSDAKAARVRVVTSPRSRETDDDDDARDVRARDERSRADASRTSERVDRGADTDGFDCERARVSQASRICALERGGG